MADYEDLETIIGQMKRAAIDSLMADHGYFPAWGRPQTYAKWHCAPLMYWRPGEDGEGGGDLTPGLVDPAVERAGGIDNSADVVSLAPEFDAVRLAIDELVKGWRGLPDGSVCDGLQDHAGTAAAQLGAAGSRATVEGNGEIKTANSTVGDVVTGRLEGSFRAPFLDKYYTQFSKVSEGLGQACAILEANYAAEAAMWPAVRTDVATICDAARAAWAAHAQKASDHNTTVVLTVVNAVATAVSAVVTAGGSVGIAVATGALSGISGAAQTALAASDVPDDGSVSGGDFQTILASLTRALTNLRETVYSQEQTLNTMLTEAAGAIEGSRGDFDLDAYAIQGSSVSSEWMRMSRSDATIVSGNMRRIEDALATVGARLGTAPHSAPTPRPGGIGRSPTGTHAAASALHDLTAHCLDSTAAEYARGHALFDATVDDFFSVDEDARRTVKRLAAEEALTARTEV